MTATTKSAHTAGRKPRIYHKGTLIRHDGAVSSLCFVKPRAIDLRVSSWTNRAEAVTCQKCLALLAAAEARANG